MNMKQPTALFEVSTIGAFAAGLAKCTLLEHLDMCFFKTDVDGFRVFSRAVSTLTNLKNLVLNYMNPVDKRGIGDTAWPSFFAALTSCTQLEQLDLAGSSIGSVPSLAKLMEQAPLKALNLDECGIGAEGMVQICKALANLTVLESFYACDNSIDNEGIKALSASLLLCPLLEILCVPQNSDIEFSGVVAIAIALESCSNLRELDMSGCDISAEGISKLFKAIPLCPELTDFNVDYNRGGPEAAEVLLATIPKLGGRETPLEVRFSYNDIGHEVRGKLIELEEASPLINVEMEHDGEDAEPESEDGSEGDGGEGGGFGY
jgi:Ran GTPase-activating protein (RanGAP) involved in mRNA processing and transport